MKENIFTSTGEKLLFHPTVVARIKQFKAAYPISLQIAPTSLCNLKCCFCSNVNRNKNEELDFNFLFSILENLVKLGLKTVEWTGGGEPSLYSYINEMILVSALLNLKQGFITNGTCLNKLTKENLDRLSWLRISMNCLDYVNKIDIPEIKGVLGFSYVMNEKTSNDVLNYLHEYVKKYKPKYVRIVPNCQTSQEEQEKNNEWYSKLIARWGEPYFYQAKHFEKPQRCWWGYIKPFLLHDGWAYPCSSIVLNEDAEQSFHEKYRWVKGEDLHNLYSKPMISFDPKNCAYCVFTKQNILIDNILNPNGMEDFV